jgi:hypothetical protein
MVLAFFRLKEFGRHPLDYRRACGKIYRALHDGFDTIAFMSKLKCKSRIPKPPLQTGQVWRMGDSNLHVELVGKHLVHYKLVKVNAKRTPTSLSVIDVVEKYLKANKAVLVR